jgi:putative flippase GtrA
MSDVGLIGRLLLVQRFDILAFAKFGLVGAATAVIYFLVMWFADSIVGLGYLVVVSLAYFASTVFHFLANRHFTFSAASGQCRRQMVRYLVMWSVNYVITLAVVGFCVERFHFSPYIGVCVSVLFTLCVGFLLGRYWVFKLEEERL